MGPRELWAVRLLTPKCADGTSPLHALVWSGHSWRATWLAAGGVVWCGAVAGQPPTKKSMRPDLQPATAKVGGPQCQCASTGSRRRGAGGAGAAQHRARRAVWRVQPPAPRVPACRRAAHPSTHRQQRCVAGVADAERLCHCGREDGSLHHVHGAKGAVDGVRPRHHGLLHGGQRHHAVGRQHLHGHASTLGVAGGVCRQGGNSTAARDGGVGQGCGGRRVRWQEGRRGPYTDTG